MRVSKFALLVYFVFTITAIVANIYGNHTLLLVSKPFVVPSIFFYYFVMAKKVNFTFSIAVLCSFIGEGIGLMNFSDEIYYMLIPFFISNILLSILCIKNFDKFKFLNIGSIPMVIVSVFLIYLYLAVIDLFSDATTILQLQIIMYGSSLLFLSILATYKIIAKMNLSNLNLSIFVICSIFSGIFYAIYNFKERLIVLDIIHFALQMISYYFMINFKLYQEKQENKF